MLSKIELILILVDENKSGNVYLLNKLSNILLTYNVPRQSFVNTIDTAQIDNLIKQKHMLPLFVELNFLINKGIINCYTDKRLIKVHTQIMTALLYAQCKPLPAFVSQKYLLKEGITVSKKLIEDMTEC